MNDWRDQEVRNEARWPDRNEWTEGIRAEFIEVFAPLVSRPSSSKALKVEVGGFEPPSPGDRSGLLRAQPVEDLASRLPPAERLSASPGELSDGGPRAEPLP